MDLAGLKAKAAYLELIQSKNVNIAYYKAGTVQSVPPSRNRTTALEITALIHVTVTCRGSPPPNPLSHWKHVIWL